jgi:hypothetical protein
VTKGIEEIALIFVAVEAAQQLAFAVYIRTADIVAGGDIIGT